MNVTDRVRDLLGVNHFRYPTTGFSDGVIARTNLDAISAECRLAVAGHTVPSVPLKRVRTNPSATGPFFVVHGVVARRRVLPARLIRRSAKVSPILTLWPTRRRIIIDAVVGVSLELHLLLPKRVPQLGT